MLRFLYPDWDGVLTAEDERGLTPLFWSHVLHTAIR